ncbi:hypothetical protein D9M71_760290 [compost metagenome]
MIKQLLNSPSLLDIELKATLVKPPRKGGVGEDLLQRALQDAPGRALGISRDRS